jgi:hypothetical protein
MTRQPLTAVLPNKKAHLDRKSAHPASNFGGQNIRKNLRHDLDGFLAEHRGSSRVRGFYSNIRISHL